jgi:hypothetical protein
LKGQVVFLYAFDVANEIQSSRVRAILSEQPLPLQIRPDRTGPKGVFPYRPLAIEPRPLDTTMRGQPVRLMVRVYDVGVVAIVMRVNVEVENLLDLLCYHGQAFDSGQTVSEAAAKLCSLVSDNIRDAMISPGLPTEPEAYTVFSITELEGISDVSEWARRERRNIAGLLCETDPEQLSDDQVAESTRLHQSFEKGDLVVIDWDAALLVDLSGYVDDVLYTLELANLQLEEFRALDQRLDKYLDRMYEDLERRPRWGTPLATLQMLRRLRVDVAKLDDEVTHITKFFGDWYMARVYISARDRFHLDQWRQSVEHRLSELGQVHGIIAGELYDRRMLWLEIAIVVLFIIDILGLLFLKR